MPAIFTDQWKKEQELEEERRMTQSQQKIRATQARHTVVVYAWLEDAKPVMVHEFQEGPSTFTWPYFALSMPILSNVDFTMPDGSTVRIHLYRKGLSTWVNVSIGHVIELQEGARIFLKATHVTDCQDFDKLLSSEADSPMHLCYNLPGECRELLERYQSKRLLLGKRKGVDVIEITSSEDESTPGGCAKLDLCSRRHFRKQRLPASLFHPSPSPAAAASINTGDVASAIEVSDDSHPSSRSITPMPNSLDAVSEVPSLSPLTKQWPAGFYAVNIVQFFTDCEEKLTVPMGTIFRQHFPGLPCRHSTINENHKRWQDAPQSVHDNVLRAGQSDEGLWSVFQMQTRKKAKV
ncbi:hypothetical protein CPB84DRAFT_1852373 [Gymnopilus junonius]|uniref:Uncharacterized protein n=1 Tax=Gymnopilus junonius TaxID=109634 RepID=A0A9P5NCQ5_GYMJU|nr:hypothetical protein CPB84DRAFT_1852373 [Gymnopilus junonius]